MTDNSITMFGGIDEPGYINNMTRRGWTPAKCILELVANILDALNALDRIGGSNRLSKKVIFDVGHKITKIIDNAIGMNGIDIANMLLLHRENHSSDTSRGVSGVGAKPALFILSNKGTVHIYTWKFGEPNGYHITLPWDKIFKEGKYTGMTSVKPMTEEEKLSFIVERRENDMLNENNQAHGTTIEIETNDKLRDVISQNFTPIEDENNELKPLDRIAIVFGHDNNIPLYLQRL